MNDGSYYLDTDGATAVEDNDEDPIDDVDNEVEEEGIIEEYVEDSNEGILMLLLASL